MAPTVDAITHGLTAEEREKYAKLDGFFIRLALDAFDTYEIDALRDRIEDTYVE